MMDKIKLYIIGVLVAVVLGSFAGLFYLLWQQSRDIAAAEASVKSLTIQRDNLLEANKATFDALQALARAKSTENDQLVKIQAKLDQISKTVIASQATRKKAADNDPTVKEFLSTPIPDGLRVRSVSEAGSSGTGKN